MIRKSYLGWAVAAVVWVGLAASVSAGQVKGKVTLKGTPPEEKKIRLDPFCGKLHKEAPTTRHFVVGKDSGLGNVFVYIKSGLEGKKFEPKGEPTLLDQVNCEYSPYVIGVMTGQKFKIRNSDSLMHNVHAMPTVKGNTGFNFAQVFKGQTNEKQFDQPEVYVRFKCDVHPWMFAYVGVVDHPFFAVTDENGGFSLPEGLPAGKYTLEFNHRKAGVVTQELTLGEGESKEIAQVMEAKDGDGN